MNEMQKDQFDILISAAVVQCVHGDADNLSCVDTSGVPDTSRLYKRVMRNLPGRRRTVVKAAVAAALIAALLALTACACLPDIREYFWSVVTDWYGEYFEVSFEQEEYSPDHTTEYDTSATPTEIEQKAVLTKLPEGCHMGDETMSVGQYSANYYNDNDEWVFSLVQNVSENNTLHVDGENAEVVCICIGQNEALLTEEPIEDRVLYNLVWQENDYHFTIIGYFDSVSTLVKIVDGLILE